MIEVIDRRGDAWHLAPLGFGRAHMPRMVEMWMYVGDGARPLPKYNRIPVPVFTDWWPTC